MIVIEKINFPIYIIIVLLSLIIGMAFNYIYLRKKVSNREHILLFIFMCFVYSFIGGIILNSIISMDFSIKNIGLSSYGGAIGIVISAVFFEKICKDEKYYLESAILSLPLIYSISKIACFLVGCCYGIPYNGLMSVIYPSVTNEPVLPIQLIETIVFLIIFIICLKKRDNKNIVEITILLCAVSKLLLDFFRYTHNTQIISTNQIISLFIIIILIILMIKKEKIKTKDFIERD